MKDHTQSKINKSYTKRLGHFYLLILFCITSVLYAQSQNKQITGTVKDQSGEIIIGASVVQKGTTNGTITDLNGNYKLTVPPKSTVIVSYIGYITHEFTVDGKTSFDIVLQDDNKALEEVVVVGYGTTVKKDLTTAVTSISSKDFLQGAVNNPMQMIDWKVAGLSISNPAAGDPNREPDLQIRGASSMMDASNKPLIIIDGMPGGDLRNLAQQDIESITVLKDGGSAAIYGSRAAGGVILVQTKQAKSGRVSMLYDSFVEHDAVARRPDILSPQEFVDRGRATDWGSRTDWYDALINHNNFGQNHNLSLSGGGDNTQFRLSGNYRTKEGLDIASNRKEYGIRGNFKQITLEKLLEVRGDFSYRVSEEKYLGFDNDHNPSYEVFKQAVKLNPTVNVDEMAYFKNRYDEYNPVKDVTERELGATQSYSTVNLNFKLNLAKNLSTELLLARQGRNMKRREYYTSKHRDSIDKNRKGRARLQSEDWIDWTLEWINNYSFKLDKHDVKLMGGYSYQEFNNEGFWAENMDFPHDALTYNALDKGMWNLAEGRLGMDSWKSQERTIAFLTRVNYAYGDQILFSGSFRREGNSKFGADSKWGSFPAASLAWRFSKLPIFERISNIDDLKARVSYGVTGRSGFPRYLSLPYYQGWGYQLDSNGVWRRVWGPANNPNTYLRWERQVSYNLGFDYTLFNSRLSGSLDFFIRQGKDIISEYDVSIPPNIHQKSYMNLGSTTSKGVEFLVNWNPVRTNDFSYNITTTLSYTKTRLVSFSDGGSSGVYRNGDNLPSPGNPGPAQRLIEGSEIGTFFLYRYAGVDENGQMLIYKGGKINGEKILASNAQESDKDFIGHGVPRYELGWGNNFTYKNFDLSLFFRGRFDYQILNTYQMYFGLQAEPEVNLLRDAFTRNGHIKSGKVVADYFLESGDFLRLDYVTLGWTPKIKSKYVSSLRLYGTVRNVFTITKYTGLDPAAVNVANMFPGVADLGTYPIARNLSLGVQISY